MDFEHERLETCCFTCHSGGGHITLNPEYKGEMIDWGKFFELKRKYREEHKKGNILPNCTGCIFLEEKEWEWMYNRAMESMFYHLDHEKNDWVKMRTLYIHFRKAALGRMSRGQRWRFRYVYCL